ncbi:hypothetical protein HU200_041929 [Digitaria exilis]|uniref:F-box domain-containing protein n=1 Tax=Digitaria exilis TaxID=1010633 RepID=A0A835BH77_9POAL|nr:hypothetical protein HU200_041929 [Digitaria exilis]
MDRRRSTAELRLPDDMLANVLGRLPPRSLVASRCVHKHWRSIIDARHLLRTDLLPLRLDGFFCNPLDLECCPSFFARPSTTRRITGCRLDFSDTLKGYPDIIDHCNGLLLLWESVVNPATIALSNDKYQMIKSPTAGAKLGEYPLSYLGKSEKGVYSALLHRDADSLPHCRVWLLNERCGQMEWVLKTEMSLVDNIPLHFTNKYSKPWSVSCKKGEACEQEELDEWDFDDGSVFETKDNKGNRPYWCGMVFLGFHPYKRDCLLLCTFFQIIKSGILSFEYFKGSRVGHPGCMGNGKLISIHSMLDGEVVRKQLSRSSKVGMVWNI